eukprot:scaffold1598_cov285-Prasinococcus_capsulatus_cf.AAC.6
MAARVQGQPTLDTVRDSRAAAATARRCCALEKAVPVTSAGSGAAGLAGWGGAAGAGEPYHAPYSPLSCSLSVLGPAPMATNACDRRARTGGREARPEGGEGDRGRSRTREVCSRRGLAPPAMYRPSLAGVGTAAAAAAAAGLPPNDDGSSAPTCDGTTPPA